MTKLKHVEIKIRTNYNTLVSVDALNVLEN
jgi:hypothetical protein